MRPRRPLLLFVSTIAAVTAGWGQVLSDDQVNIIGARLADAAQRSWELGTRTQAILDINATSYSVFSNARLPPPQSTPGSESSGLSSFFSIPRSIVQNRAKANNNAVGPQPLLPDGSAADPASIGMSVLLANWTGQDGGKVDYEGAARDQLSFLLEGDFVPKTSDGAISHRVSEVQLWSDFIFMVPPFLAYYGVVTRNRTLLAEAYNQISLYRDTLLDPKTGMWRHILLGTSGNDPGFWTTGNGWAAAGMLRVQATIRNSEYANTFKTEQNNLATWVRQIHAGIFPHLDNTNLFTNYADQPPTAPGNFYDASGTTLLAATVYRTALQNKQYTFLPFAERIRKELSSTNSSSSSSLDGYEHFTPDGYLRPVVNPSSFGQKGNVSAEGQAFVVLMHAGWKEWVKEGSHGANAARRRVDGGTFVRWQMVWLGVGLGLVLSAL